MSPRPAIASWPLIEDGGALHRSSTPTLEARDASTDFVKPPPSAELSLRQTQMVLGTLLGDGCITRTTRYARYRGSHGWPQATYNWTKYTVLAEYVSSLPLKRKNDGYGTFLSVFATITHPAFDCWYDLTYPIGAKTVTPAWLEAIDRVGFLPCLGWWMGDDGSRAGTDWSPAFAMHTQGFSAAEVGLLAEWVTGHGYSASTTTVKNKRRTYDIVLIGLEGALKLIDELPLHMPPSMRYKVAATARTGVMTCIFCRQEFSTTAKYTRRDQLTPCCGSPACRRSKHNLASRKCVAKTRTVEVRGCRS